MKKIVLILSFLLVAYVVQGQNTSVRYYGVNLSGAEFGGVYPGIDGTHYGYPTIRIWIISKKKVLPLFDFLFGGKESSK